MAMFKSAENLLSSIRDAIFRLPKNNSIIIAYEHLPTAGSGIYKLRVPSNAKKAVIYVEDQSMPTVDITVNSTPAYLQPDAFSKIQYTSKILLGRYQIVPAVPIPIETITSSAGTAVVVLSPSSTTSTDRSHPFFNSMVVTITGSPIAAFNGSWTVTSTTANQFSFASATSGTAIGGVVTYSNLSTISGSLGYSVNSQRDGIPIYRGETITIEGYDNLLSFRCAVNTGIGVGLKILYYS